MLVSSKRSKDNTIIHKTSFNKILNIILSKPVKFTLKIGRLSIPVMLIMFNNITRDQKMTSS